jgi:hypothetical protein
LAATKHGTVYGVAYSGGDNDVGVFFKLSQDRGIWRYKNLHSFSRTEPYSPVGLLLDRKTGTFYGAAENGGSAAFGAVFKLVPSGKSWAVVTLHNFFGAGDGANPKVRPTLDPKTGILYGVTANGGNNNLGAVYMISP